MTTTTTARILQIADDLRAEGAYTSANSIEALLDERNKLLAAGERSKGAEEGPSAPKKAPPNQILSKS